MSSAYKKFVGFYHRYEPGIIVGLVVIFAHLGWRKIQDIPGVGDPGRGYPHERVSHKL
jgi:hypothetical protein